MFKASVRNLVINTGQSLISPMVTRFVAILAILMSVAIVPQLLIKDAYAKGPIHNPEHEIGQYMQLMIVPMGIAIVVLGVWAMRARQDQIMAK